MQKTRKNNVKQAGKVDTKVGTTAIKTHVDIWLAHCEKHRVVSLSG